RDLERVARDHFDVEPDIRVRRMQSPNDPGQVEDAGAEGNLGEKETLAVLLEAHILQVGGERARGECLDDLQRIFEESDAIAGIKAYADMVVANPLEDGEKLVGAPVLVVLDGKANAVPCDQRRGQSEGVGGLIGKLAERG